ncbi:uncharacterized protein LOC106660453 [Trichogramma pretiosum]|nr:uncharacterized protein LOC106660453 [Trichogramma pretiosum]
MDRKPTEFESSYNEESIGSGLLRSMQQKPLAYIGLLGMVGACSYGYMRYKTRGVLHSTSLFLMQLRVGAQAMVVGTISIGMVYNAVNQYNLRKEKQRLKNAE